MLSAYHPGLPGLARVICRSQLLETCVSIPKPPERPDGLDLLAFDPPEAVLVAPDPPDLHVGGAVRIRDCRPNM